LLRKEDFTDRDIAEGYKLINDIQAMDSTPDQLVLDLLGTARLTIIFRYNDNQFRDIMNRALALIHEEKYWEAIALYKEAIGLHREIFAEEYSEDIIHEADNIAVASKEIIDTLLTYQSFYPQAAQRATRESSREIQSVLNSREYDDFINLIARMAVIREEMSAVAAASDKRKNELLRPGEYDIPFLSTVNKVVRGRGTTATEEGILAAVDYIWNNVIDENAALLALRSDMFFNRGKTQFNERQYRNAEISFDIAKNYSEIENNLISLKGYSISPAEGFDAFGRSLNRLSNYIPQYYESEKKIKASNDYLLLSQIMQRMTVVENNYPRETVFNNIVNYRNQVLTDNGMISINQTAWKENEESMLRLKEAAFSVDTALNLSTEMKNLFGEYETRFNLLAVSIIRAGIDLSYLPISTRLRSQESDAKSGFEMVDGIPLTIGQGDGSYTVVARYHQRAMDIFTRTLTGLTGTENDLKSVLGMISEDGREFSSYPAVRESSESVNNDLATIANLRVEINRYMQTSQELLTRSEVYRNQGNRYISEARANLARNNFDAARQNLEQAGESYVNSLNLNEDTELRTSSDRERFALSDEILSKQTTFVIEAVRKNLNEAKDLYARERFGDAENLLLSSQTLWKTVNYEDNNTELEFWLGLVQTALSVRTGRVIAETDPLYNEMTQILNLARSDYLNAVSANQSGNRAEMLTYLNQAEDKLRFVTIPFPLNQEASILSLRILQLKDLPSFNAMFRERYDFAVQMIDINPAEAYIILNDLRVINPNYSGMTQVIYRTEIRLGMRTAPPDPAKIREAETLYQRAFTIVSSNVRSNFPTALAYLNRAFELNPDDTRITTLKDRVQTEMGGRATFVLSNDAEQQYRRAEQEFVNGNFYVSLTIVERLLQDPRNRNYTPLLELKRRIEARI
ncbi:MAG: hypothetical protein FWF38_06610, partial [Spirochaetaceae bacterium]|nr:hypothetical protein [Spirochaetaceae bacterium]